MNERQQALRATASWWLLATGLAAALKVYFSAAATSELEWMLRPVALLLRIVTGWSFSKAGSGEWYSLEAGIVLVKACAGINFMTLSFLGWCWLCRPRYFAALRQLACEWPVLLASSLVLAWVAALIVNTLRILAIVHWQPALEQWLPPEEAHRFLGLLVYVSALNLQLLVFDRRRWRTALLIGCGAFAGLMLLLPLMTGNAAHDAGQYLRHALSVLLVLLPFVLVATVRRWRSHGEPGGS